MANFTPSWNRITVTPGDKFNRFTVISESEPLLVGKAKHRAFLCRCNCGTEKIIDLCHLRDGHSKSCGCIATEKAPLPRTTPKRKFTADPRHKRENHGESATGNRLYNIWAKMRHRCLFESDPAFKDYGGRGITVCVEWDSYTVFRAWALENGYESTLTIDREENDGNYEPSNCRWVTMLVQSRNTRSNRYITAFGETKIITDWLTDPRCNASWPTINKRLRHGLSPEVAISRTASESRLATVPKERRREIGILAAAGRWGKV